MDTNKHDIIVTEAFRAALFRVKIAASEGGSEGACFIRRFLRACLWQNVVPGFITKRIFSSKMKHNTTVEWMFILDEIGRLNRTRSTLRRVE